MNEIGEPAADTAPVPQCAPAASMKIIAVTNIKGGVGKTTTAVNLAYLCAASGRPTLLWDLDPQAAATYVLKGQPREHVSPKKLLTGKRELPGAQSRNKAAYDCRRDLLILSSRSVGRLRRLK